jgi:hypothetical protein
VVAEYQKKYYHMITMSVKGKLEVIDGEEDSTGSGFFQLLPDFSFSDASGQELLTVRCERRYPLTRFLMVENGLPVCTIRQRSILLNKYTLEFHSGSEWTFYIPLFSVHYKAISDGGAEVLVRLFRHDEWYLLFPPGLDSLHLVAALAFIHKERQRFA